MIGLTEATKDWATDGKWKIAPARLTWIAKGKYVSIGNGVTLGNGVWLGNGVTLGDDVKLGKGVTLGEYVRLGNGVTLGDDVTLGDGVTLGDKSTDAIDLGCADGYRKCIAQVDGVAYIGAGCLWFTLAEALKHWSNKPNRELTMCLMMAAVHIAGFKGWKHGDEK